MIVVERLDKSIRRYVNRFVADIETFLNGGC